MICKWCGAAMERSGTVCRRCGREVPAMSHCGGFYDLVPHAGQSIPVAAVETENARPQKKPGLLGFVCAVLAILLAASVIACVMISAEKQTLAEEVEELEEQLEKLEPYVPTVPEGVLLPGKGTPETEPEPTALIPLEPEPTETE